MKKPFVMLCAISIVGCGSVPSTNEMKGPDGRVIDVFVTRSGEEIPCVRPPAEVITTVVGGTANLASDIDSLGKILNANLTAERTVQRIRQEVPGAQHFEIVDYRMCVAYANGIVDSERYRDWILQISQKFRSEEPDPKTVDSKNGSSARGEDMPPRLSISRVADFYRTSCNANHQGGNSLVLSDVMTFSNYSRPTYLAQAMESGTTSVSLVDMHIGDNRSAQLVRDVSLGSSLRQRAWNLTVKDQVARAKWIWTTTDDQGQWPIGFVSDYVIDEVDIRYLLPDGVEIRDSVFSGNVAGLEEKCIRVSEGQFRCSNLELPPRAVLMHRWNSNVPSCTAWE